MLANVNDLGSYRIRAANVPSPYRGGKREGGWIGSRAKCDGYTDISSLSACPNAPRLSPTGFLPVRDFDVWKEALNCPCSVLYEPYAMFAKIHLQRDGWGVE